MGMWRSGQLFSSLAPPVGVFCGSAAGQLWCSPSQSSGVSQGLASRLATKDWEHGESHMPKMKQGGCKKCSETTPVSL